MQSESVRNDSDGFTLIELAIIVAIIGILAAIAIPMYATLTTKAQEGSAKGQLATVRSALSIYYGDNEAIFPDSLTGGLVAGSKYLQVLPLVLIPAVATRANPGHAPDRTETVTLQAPCPPTFADAGAPIWYYDDAGENPCQGTVYFQCTHLTYEGNPWSAY